MQVQVGRRWVTSSASALEHKLGPGEKNLSFFGRKMSFCSGGKICPDEVQIEKSARFWSHILQRAFFCPPLTIELNCSAQQSFATNLTFCYPSDGHSYLNQLLFECASVYVFVLSDGKVQFPIGGLWWIDLRQTCLHPSLPSMMLLPACLPDWLVVQSVQWGDSCFCCIKASLLSTGVFGTVCLNILKSNCVLEIIITVAVWVQFV